MSGPKLLNTGLPGFKSQTANDEWRAPPPLAIVRNEAEMVRALQAELAAVGRDDKTCCIVIAKPHTDAGASQADIMAAVGARFSRSLRPYDGLFAFGEDRYLMSLPHIKLEDTVTVMNRLCGRISEDPLDVVGAGPTSVNVFIGGMMIDAAVSLEDNIERANQALFRAMRAGGEDVCLWSPDIGAA